MGQPKEEYTTHLEVQKLQNMAQTDKTIDILEDTDIMCFKYIVYQPS